MLQAEAPRKGALYDPPFSRFGIYGSIYSAYMPLLHPPLASHFPGGTPERRFLCSLGRRVGKRGTSTCEHMLEPKWDTCSKDACML